MTEDQLNRFQEFFQKQQLDAAYDVVAEAILCNEADWNALYIAGTIHRYKNDFRGAIRFYTKALRYNAQEPAIWQALGIAHQLLDELPSAIDALNAAIKLNPGSYEAHNSLGITYELARDYPSAIRAFEWAQEVCVNRAFEEVKRDHPEYFRTEQRGQERILHANQAYMEAVRQILVTDFNYFNVLKNMVQCYMEMGDHKRAHELQDHVDTCTPINVDIIGPFRQ